MEEFGSATLCTYRTVKFWGITCITKIFSFAYTAQWQWYTVNMKYCCVQDCKTNNTTAGVSLHKFPKNENLRKLWILAASLATICFGCNQVPRKWRTGIFINSCRTNLSYCILVFLFLYRSIYT